MVGSSMRRLFSRGTDADKTTAPQAQPARSLSDPTSAATGPSQAWDGKCKRCRKLMSQCLCHEDQQQMGNRERTPSIEYSFPPSEKRHLFETLSEMHSSRTHSRLPIKMTQDRSRDRRLKDGEFHSARSAPSMSCAEPPSDKFSRSYPDAKWRSSTAIKSTVRLAHAPSTIPARRESSTKNLLSYESKKPTNRFNHVGMAPVVPGPQVPSQNYYVERPIRRRSREDEPNNEEVSEQIWEL
ncbi:hypothetical protein Poli38472_009163 [Pythium oligandrum]|uniref:Uncharacterized protein n=1 Tax=Pythium oligandrum TaxID=41045 RepID=A0A8K1FJJ5_PYTOL|nr:hypothetical protein Poli38472_009163 [Pythium oligandrum]|eukprot:TMW64996.1 hypothetical protein Poli38472_009163 [Pythium oligandrum]